MKKTVIITNPGEIDPLAFELIGASTKRDDAQTIGFFGSGLKYAIAGLLRSGIDFQIWSGDRAVDITTEAVSMRGQTFNRVIIDGRPTSLTTEIGPKWERWMFIRELYANAVDEGGEMAVSDTYSEWIAPGRTTIIFPTPEQIEDVINQQDLLFCRGREIMYEDDALRIYDEVGDGGFYVRGILVYRGMHGYGYELKRTPYDLNEERQVSSSFTAAYRTTDAIFGITDRKAVRRIVSRAKGGKSFEHGLLVGGYASVAAKGSDAWSDIVLFAPEDAKWATEWNHLPVSQDVYDNVKNVAKWTAAKWRKLDLNTDALNEAVANVERVAPGLLPSCSWSFGSSLSRKLGMGIEGDTMFIAESFHGMPTAELSAHIALSLLPESTRIILVRGLFENLSK